MTDHGENLTEAQRVHYENLLADGYDPLLASIYASQRMPAISTNNTITRGMGAQVWSNQLGAMVDTDDYRHNVRRIARQKNLTIDGLVKHTGHQDDRPVDSPRLAPDIVERVVNERIAEDPGLRTRDRNELRSEVIERHGRPK